MPTPPERRNESDPARRPSDGKTGSAPHRYPRSDEDLERMDDEEIEAILAEDPEADVPEPIAKLGRVGVWLAGGSAALAPVGLAAAYAGVQPFGNAALATSLVGVTVAMVLGAVVETQKGGSVFAWRRR